MPQIYYLSNTNSDLSGGADFNKVLSTSTETASTISIPVNASATEVSYGYTAAGVPSVGGVSTGTFTVEVNVTTSNTNITISIALARVNSAGTQQAVTAYSTGQSAGTTGVKTFTFTNPALGTWTAGDRLRVQYRFVNANSMSSQTVAIQTGSTSTEVSTPFYAEQATLYWVGGSGTWDNTNVANWAGSSGGTGGLSWPTSITDVFFDGSSDLGTGYTTTVSTGATCKDITISGLDQTMTLAGSTSLLVNGNALFPATNFTSTYTGGLAFVSTRGTINNLNLVLWSGSQFVAVGNTGTILTSPDGVTWTTQTSGTTNNLFKLAWSGSQFIAVGATGTILTSPVGVTWTAQTSGTTNNLLGVTWGNSQFVAVGATGTIRTSPTGVTWTAQTSGTTSALNVVTWSGTQFVAAGVAGTIITSPDGVTWTAQTSGTSNTLNGVTWSGTQFIAVGNSGTIRTSPDGVTWTAQTSGVSAQLSPVTWSGSQFVAVGATGTIITSPDGVTWTAQTSGTSNTLNGVTWSGTQFIAVGNSGTIITSPTGVTWSFGTGPTRMITTNGTTLNFSVLFVANTSKLELQDALTLGATNTFTLTAGALDLNGFNLSTGLFSSSNSNRRSIAFGANKILLTGIGTIWSMGAATEYSISGTPVVDCTNSSSSARTVATGNLSEANTSSYNITAGSGSFTITLNVKNLNFTGFSGTLSNGALNVYGNLTVSSGMSLAAGTNPITFSLSAGTQELITNGKTIPFPITKNNGGALVLQDNLTLEPTRTLTLASGTLNANTFNVTTGLFSSSSTIIRTLTMGSGTWTLTGTGAVWDTTNTTNLTFNKNTANIVLSGTSTSARTFGGGGLTYNNLAIGGATGVSELILTGSNTFNTISSTKTVSHSIYFEGGSTTKVIDWTVSGSAGNLVQIRPTWLQLRVSGTTNFLYGVTWNGTQFVAVGATGTIRTSPTGVTWTAQTSGTTSALNVVTWSGTQFVAAGVAGTIITSPDGVTWTAQTSGTTEDLNGVTWSGTQFAAVGGNGSIFTSPDGVTWTQRLASTGSFRSGIVWGNSLFVAVGNATAQDPILTSPDGITWTAQTSPSIYSLSAITWSGTQFVAVGNVGTIITSPDGVTWTAQTSGTSNTLNGVTWSGTQFIAVGNSGTIRTSPDGVTWTAQTSGATNFLYGVTWSGSQFVVAGGSGYIGTNPTEFTLEQI